MNILRPDPPPNLRDSPPAPPQPARDDEIDIGHLFLVAWKGKRWIALFTVLALMVGAFIYANTPRTYQADALIQLEDRGGRLALPEAMRELVESSTTAETETQILSSRMVLGQAVAELNLDWVVQPTLAPLIGSMVSRYPIPLPDHDLLRRYARPGERLTLDLLQVPPEWLGDEIILTVTPEGYRITTPDERTHQGHLGETLGLSDIGFALNVQALEAPPGREFRLRQISMLEATTRLRNNMRGSESGRQSGILRVTMTAPPAPRPRAGLMPRSMPMSARTSPAAPPRPSAAWNSSASNCPRPRKPCVSRRTG